MRDLEVKSVSIGRYKGLGGNANLQWLQGRDDDTTADRVTGSATAYELVPLIFRAVRLRCDALASVPVHVWQGEQDVGWPFPSSLSEIIWQTEAALLLKGFAVWLKTPNWRRVEDVEWLNPYGLQVEWDERKGRIIKSSAKGNTGPWTSEQVLFFREFRPLDDIGAGISAADVAIEDGRLLRYLTRFAARYFENGAMPVTLLSFDYAPSTEEAERIENWFKRMASGIRNAWQVMALRGKITPQMLTPVPKDLEMAALNNQARHNIAMAFGIPQTMLEDAANYATAGEHRLSFWQDTVRPRGKKYEDAINSQLFKGMGLRFEMDFEEMGVFQVDEAERSGALANLVQAGMDTLTAAEVLGYQLTEEQKERIEKAEAVVEPPVEEQLQTEVQTTETRRHGVDDLADKRAYLFEERTLALIGALKMWERKVLKRLKEGKKAGCGFESEAIPDSLRGPIEGALEEITSSEEVKRIFTAAREWGTYP